MARGATGMTETGNHRRSLPPRRVMPRLSCAIFPVLDCRGLEAPLLLHPASPCEYL